MNSDLAEERASTTFKSEDFAIWWAGGVENLQKKRHIEQIFFNDADFTDKLHFAHLSHAEYYEHMLKKNVKFIQKLYSLKLIADHKPIDMNALYEFRKFTCGPLGLALFPQSAPLRLHHGMFIPALLTNASDEQVRKWLPKAWNFNGWIGSYAQTELGHGSYLKGLETTAYFDIRAQEFILNTPTLSAYKWWPGSLGNTANVAVVVANLFINGKPYGLQQFLVPLRDESTHAPLPGVEIGEIGPKIGMNGADNGFLAFKNVRIPIHNMLMKHAQLSTSGRFQQSPNPSLLYGTMMFLRVGIVSDVSLGLLVASTIATRYSLVRHQSVLEKNAEELKIMDHLTQQAKILPLIAKGIVFKLTAEKVWKMYQEYLKQLDSGDLHEMPQMHALSCVLKALCSDEASKGVEVLRKACGGHGFLANSNFGQLYGTVTAACTYEGENTVLLLQTARFLIKMMALLDVGTPLPHTVSYLEKAHKNPPHIDIHYTNLLLMTQLVEVLEHATAALWQHIYVSYEQQLEHSSPEKVVSKSAVRLTQAAIAHGQCFLARIALTEAELLAELTNKHLANVLTKILELFLVNLCCEQWAHILRFNSHITAVEVSFLEKYFEKLMADIRPNIIAVVDGFDYHDRTLNSVLGAWDGCVYERLMAAALQNPLNQASVKSAFYTHLKPLLQGKL